MPSGMERWLLPTARFSFFVFVILSKSVRENSSDKFKAAKDRWICKTPSGEAKYECSMRYSSHSLEASSVMGFGTTPAAHCLTCSCASSCDPAKASTTRTGCSLFETLSVGRPSPPVAPHSPHPIFFSPNPVRDPLCGPPRQPPVWPTIPHIFSLICYRPPKTFSLFGTLIRPTVSLRLEGKGRWG